MKPEAHFFSLFPYKTAQNFVIFSMLYLSGLSLEILTRGRGIASPSFPWSLLFVFLQLVLPLLFYKGLANKKIVTWLTSSSFVIPCLGFLFLEFLIMGLVPQLKGSSPDILSLLGFSHVLKSWHFLIFIFILVLSLEMTLVKRLSFKTLKDGAFLLNHLGLLLIVLVSFWGQGSLKRSFIELHQGVPVWEGSDEENNPLVYPFALKLKDFSLERYEPEIAFFDLRTAKILFQTKVENKIHYKNWDLSVVDKKEKSLTVRLENKNGEKKEGLIALPYMADQAKFIELSRPDELGVTLVEGKAKRYASVVEWYSPSGEKGEVTIEVNKPFSINGWTIYQNSYNEDNGPSLRVSVLEAIKDPLLPFIYLGFCMILFGTLLFIWTGHKGENHEC